MYSIFFIIYLPLGIQFAYPHYFSACTFDFYRILFFYYLRQSAEVSVGGNLHGSNFVFSKSRKINHLRKTNKQKNPTVYIHCLNEIKCFSFFSNYSLQIELQRGRECSKGHYQITKFNPKAIGKSLMFLTCCGIYA